VKFLTRRWGAPKLALVNTPTTTVTLSSETTARALALLRTIPGVRFSGQRIYVTADALPAVHATLGFRAIAPAPRAPWRIFRDPRDVYGWGKLYPYQATDALVFAQRTKELLWNVTGSGKTPTIHAALALLDWGRYEYGDKRSRVLIAAPAMTREVWARDTHWIGNASVGILIGRNAETPSAATAARGISRGLAGYREKGSDCCASHDLAELLDRQCDIIVVGLETLSSYKGDRSARIAELRAAEFSILVIDEAHKIKNWRSTRTKAIRAIAKGIGAVWQVTATPVADRTHDLLTQLELASLNSWKGWVQIQIDPGEEPGVKPAFAVRYCHGRQGLYGWTDDGPHQHCDLCQSEFGKGLAAELDQRIGYFAVRRTRADVVEYLPQVTREVRRVPAEALKAVRVSSRTAAGGWVNAYEAALVHACYAKLPAAVDLVSELLLGEAKVIVAGLRRKWVTDFMGALTRAMKRAPRPLREKLWAFEAPDDLAKRRVLCDEYMALEAGPAVLVSTIDKIGMSIDLHQTDAAVCVGLPHTPEKLGQWEGRVWRAGGRKAALYYLVATGTADEAVQASLLNKLAATVASGTNIVQADLQVLKRSAADVMAEVRAFLHDHADDIADARMIGLGET